MTKRFCIALSVDVDRQSDAYLRKHLTGVLTHNGHTVQVPDELRLLCFDYRNRGYEVFPPCDHTDALGQCLGHDVDSDRVDHAAGASPQESKHGDAVE